MARKKQFNTRYSPEFKISVILDMRENGLGYNDTARKYWSVTTHREASNHRSQIRLLKRIYLEEGAAGLYVERRGRTRKMENPKKGRPRKRPLPKEVEQDLIAENQRIKEQLEYLQMENDYLKKLDALVREEEQRKKHKTLAFSELRRKYNFGKLLKYAALPRSTYYYQSKKSRTNTQS